MSSPAFASVSVLEYLDIATAGKASPILPVVAAGQVPAPPMPVVPAAPAVSPGVAEAEVQRRIANARAEAIAETEQRLGQDRASGEQERATQVGEALRRFETERSTYFSKVEAEVVQLALAISRKIIRREAQMDPMLLAALVRIGLDQMQSGPAVTLRVPAAAISWWTARPELAGGRRPCEVVGDETLSEGDCVMETNLGSANLGFEAQLKEVEQGFFDLLAQRPGGV